eukprot:TRINITY_DN36169_c0_g1_i1.p1 TRINITY_DN36169_c0_g1~~TRINITY_DN36169_c0_g1_i1.p1  ORF type:complete len:376 (-),score=109.80 TRINITY_DN36169_c0_g1_i1:356-1396(-)
MAAAMDLSDEHRDEVLTQFLTMTDDRVDPDVARSLLEATGWDLQAAVEQLYGQGPTSRPPTAPVATEQDLLGGMGGGLGAGLGGGMGGIDPALLGAMGGSMGMGAGGMGHIDPAFAAGVEDDDLMGLNQHMRPLRPASDLDADGDAQLAAAIEASYFAQTDAGQALSENEQLAKAMELSQAAEENRQRQQLREQQEAELLESEFMDRQREQEEERRQVEEEELRRAAERSQQDEEQRERESAAQDAAELEAKRARLPEEPPAGEPGRVLLVLRLPNGQRLQRAFSSSNTVGCLYDFVDLQREELTRHRYRLVSTMPRKAFEDRQAMLSEAGIENSSALMVEMVSGL